MKIKNIMSGLFNKPVVRMYSDEAISLDELLSSSDKAIINNGDIERPSIINISHSSRLNDEFKFSKTKSLENYETQKNINNVFDDIIYTIVEKVLKKKVKKEKLFFHYLYDDDDVLDFQSRNKIKEYLIKYFKRGNSYISKFNRTYSFLNEKCYELSDLLNRPLISNYNDLATYGRKFYDENAFDMKEDSYNSYLELKKEDIVTVDKIETSDDVSLDNIHFSNTDLNEEEPIVLSFRKEEPEVNDVVLPEIKTKSKAKNKIKKVTTKEIDDLKREKRVLLNKIKKLELEMNKLSLILKMEKKYEILMYKKMILNIEKSIILEKKSNDIFKEEVSNSYMVRKERALKSINVYFKQYNKGLIQENFEEFFGLEQIEYFRSLGIDIYSMIEETKKNK